MGEAGQFVCNTLDEVCGHIGDGDGEAFDGGRRGGGERDDIARGVLQRHLCVFFWLQHQNLGDLNDACGCGEEVLS